MPQIEIMQSDQPHTLFNGKQGAKQEDIDEATRLTLEAAKKKKERQAKDEYTTEEVFNGDADKDE